MTALNITPKISTKEARFRGTVAAGERVAVTIAGGADWSDTGLKLRVINHRGKTLAVFPAPGTDDAWVVSGEDLTCALNLNTVQMLDAVPPRAIVPFRFVLANADSDTLYFNDECSVVHWPQEEGDEVPYDLNEWPGLIDEWTAQLASMSEDLEAHKADTDTHVTEQDRALWNGKADNADLLALAHRVDALAPLSSTLAGQTINTNTQNAMRNALRIIGAALGATMRIAAICFLLPSFGASVSLAPLGDLDLDTNPMVVTNVDFSGLDVTESDPEFSSFTNSGGIMYGPLKLWNSLGGGYDMSTVISSNGVSFWKFMPAPGGGGVWASGSFGWADLLTSESDPMVPSWAKASSKPSYNASEVGALPSSTTHVSGDVPTTRKVNNKALSADITLSASDVNAYPSEDGTALENIVNAWEGYWGGTNVVFEVTNYYNSTSGELPRLRIREFRDGGWTNVWDEVDKFRVCESNLLGAVSKSNETMRTELKQEFAPRAWGTYTDKGTTNVVGNSVWMTAPETYFAGGTEYQRVAVGAGAICVLVDNGAGTYTTGEAGTFRFQDEGGTNFFGFAKSDSYTIGCRTDGIVVDGTLVTLRYDVIMGGTDVPVVYWRETLSSGDWTRLNNADGTEAAGAPYTVTWYTSGGSYYAAINCGSNASGFFKAETSVAGDVVFETNMKLRIGGGIECLNTSSGVMGVIKPTYNGSAVTWSWSAR